MSTISTTREPRDPLRKPPSPDVAVVPALEPSSSCRSPPVELERRGRRRQLGLEVEPLQHRHPHVLGRGDRGRLPSAARLDRVDARRLELDVVERAAGGQQHRRLVGARIEVNRSGVDPAHRGGRGHAERAQHVLGAGGRDLGLGRGGRREVQAQAVVAAARDAESVARLADAAGGADALGTRGLERLDALPAHVLRSGPGAALAARERREDLGGAVVDAGVVAQQVQAAQHHAGPFRVGDDVVGPDVTVKR